jgi:hypothetical protein
LACGFGLLRFAIFCQPQVRFRIWIHDIIEDKKVVIVAREPATRENLRLRLWIDGPYGGGKTYTALRLAHLWKETDPSIESVYVIDSQWGQASKYVGWTEPTDNISWEFDRWDIEEPYHPDKLTTALGQALSTDLVIIDSISPFWIDEGGLLEIVNKSGGFPLGWLKATPLWNGIFTVINRLPCHVIMTARAKIGHEIVTGENGDKTVKTIGLTPEARGGDPYKVDIAGSISPPNNSLLVNKSHYPPLQGTTWVKPGVDFLNHLREFVNLPGIPKKFSKVEFAKYLAGTFPQLRDPNHSPDYETIAEVLKKAGQAYDPDPDKVEEIKHALADHFASQE